MASDASAMDDGLSAFERARPRLFGVAYRMLGSAAEAEDVVQDVWTRWQSADRRVVRDPQAFLTTPEGIDQIMWVMRPRKLTGVAASSWPHAPRTRPISDPTGRFNAVFDCV